MVTQDQKTPLRNRIKPAQELEIQQIMDNFNCEYDDVVEAVDLYNLDVEEVYDRMTTTQIRTG